MFIFGGSVNMQITVVHGINYIISLRIRNKANIIFLLLGPTLRVTDVISTYILPKYFWQQLCYILLCKLKYYVL